MKSPRDNRVRARVRRRGRGPGGEEKRTSSSSVSRLTSGLPASDRRPPGPHLVSRRDQDLRVVGQKEIDAGAEPDHPDPLSAPEAFPDAGIEDDSAGEGACDLLERHAAPLRRERDAVLLVLRRGLLSEGGREAAGGVLVFRDFSGDRRPVDVAVEDRHEDRKPPRSAGGSLRGGSDGEHGTVGRRNDGFLAPFGNAFRISEKGEQEKRACKKKRRYDRVPRPRGDRGRHRGKKDEDPSLAGDRDPQWATPSR